MPRDEFMILWCIVVAAIILLFVGAGLWTRHRAAQMEREDTRAPETPESVQRLLEQEKRDANRATWKKYDAALEAQRDALEAAGPPFPYMISQSDHDYLWYTYRAHIHMPWRYHNYQTSHLEEAPVDIEPLEWGWIKVGEGQRTKSDAEVILSRIIKPDENHYLYDAAGLAQGYVVKPADEDDDDA